MNAMQNDKPLAPQDYDWKRILQLFQNLPKTVAGGSFPAVICFQQKFSAALDDREVDMLGLQRGCTLRAYGAFPGLPEAEGANFFEFFATGDVCQLAEQTEVGKNYRAQLSCMFAEADHPTDDPFTRYQTTWSGLRIEAIDLNAIP